MSQAYVLPDALTALEACKTKLAELIRSDKPIPANVNQIVADYMWVGEKKRSGGALREWALQELVRFWAYPGSGRVRPLSEVAQTRRRMDTCREVLKVIAKIKAAKNRQTVQSWRSERTGDARPDDG
jgi:hypothetical protein